MSWEYVDLVTLNNWVMSSVLFGSIHPLSSRVDNRKWNECHTLQVNPILQASATLHLVMPYVSIQLHMLSAVVPPSTYHCLHHHFIHRWGMLTAQSLKWVQYMASHQWLVTWFGHCRCVNNSKRIANTLFRYCVCTCYQVLIAHLSHY